MKINKVEIHGLNFHDKIVMPITNNKLIIVADNGAGKTTILRMIFLFLSKKWIQLNEYNFESMSVVIDDEVFIYNKLQHSGSKITTQMISKEVDKYPLYKASLNEIFTTYDINDLLNQTYLISDLENKYDIPSILLVELLTNIKKQEFNESLYHWNFNVLYLPTYRRIERKFKSLYGDLSKRLEQHLKRMFPEIDSKIQSEKEKNDGVSTTEDDLLSTFDDLWSSRDNEKWLKKKDIFLQTELIEFGMEDVKNRLSRYLTQTKDMTHFNLYLSLCNKYLNENKKIELSKNSLEIQIKTIEGQILSIDTLSAGEKQIVSLFSHLLIDDEVFLIFDEPEISISMNWQEMILEDIERFNIAGMIIATHSPFIVSDNLKLFTHGLNEFIEGK